MDATLVDPLLAIEPADLSELVRQLRREVLARHQDVGQLRREHAERRQQVGSWKAMPTHAGQRAELLEAELEQLRGENRKLQDQLGGRKSATPSSLDRSHRLEGEDAPPPSTPPKRGPRKDRPGPTRRDYGHRPVVEELRELPEAQRVCPQCGAALTPSDTADSEPIESDVRADRRRLRRRRYPRTGPGSHGPRTVTTPPASQLIPQGLVGVSIGVEIRRDQFAGHRPTERWRSPGRWLGRDVAAGTGAGGLKRLEPVFGPLDDALLKRHAASAGVQAEETRWRVFIVREGKTGYRGWLWVFVGADPGAVRLDPTRRPEVPAGPVPADADVVLLVDRYAASKALAPGKRGPGVLAFCGAHVRRDLITVGKGWPEHKEGALAGLGRIRAVSRHERRRRGTTADGVEFPGADAELRQTVTAMKARADAALSAPKLPTPGPAARC